MFREQHFDIQKTIKEVQVQQLEQQRKNWNQFSSGWKKWDDLIMFTMKPIGDALISSLNVKGTEKVLDVASGTGEPGLTLSTLLPNGKVVGTDLSEKMVAIANENALIKGIQNYKSETCDAAKLPFDDETFDHVICRFGIMFFPDLNKGLGEMTRVLKKGGKMSVAVWAAPELNPFITIMASTIMQKLELPKPPENSPGIFRCAQPGFTSHLFQKAGLKEIKEDKLAGSGLFESAGQYWNVMSDVAGPLMEALEKAPHEMLNEVKNTVIETAGKYSDNGNILTPFEAIIVTGQKA